MWSRFHWAFRSQPKTFCTPVHRSVYSGGVNLAPGSLLRCGPKIKPRRFRSKGRVKQRDKHICLACVWTWGKRARETESARERKKKRDANVLAQIRENSSLRTCDTERASYSQAEKNRWQQHWKVKAEKKSSKRCKRCWWKRRGWAVRWSYASFGGKPKDNLHWKHATKDA